MSLICLCDGSSSQTPAIMGWFYQALGIKNDLPQQTNISRNIYIDLLASSHNPKSKCYYSFLLWNTSTSACRHGQNYLGCQFPAASELCGSDALVRKLEGLKLLTKILSHLSQKQNPLRKISEELFDAVFWMLSRFRRLASMLVRVLALRTSGHR